MENFEPAVTYEANQVKTNAVADITILSKARSTGVAEQLATGQ